MISKIHHIHSVGKFANFTATNPIELGKLTLIFGENGSGKSTLSDIIRSLIAEQSHRLAGRETLPRAKSQRVHLELDDGTPLIFQNGKWSATLNNVLVFDDVFVNENVYAGNVVTTDHTRNMVDIIVGEVAIRDQENAKILESKIEQLKEEREKLENEIADHIHYFRNNPRDKPETVHFLNITRNPNIESVLNDQANLVTQLRNDDTIFGIDEFSCLTLPAFPTFELTDLLSESLESLGNEAEAHVERHIEKYSSNNIRDWLSQGTMIADQDPEICPYCGQSLSSVQIIKHYRSYFDQIYQQLRSRIDAFTENYLRFEPEMSTTNQAWGSNTELCKTWNLHVPNLEVEEIIIDDVWVSLDHVTQEVDRILDTKRNAPGTKLTFTDALTTALRHWEETCNSVEKYNISIWNANDKIARRKEELGSINLDAAERELQLLRNTKSRHSPVVESLCKEYAHVSDELSTREKQLATTRQAIDTAIDQSFPNTVTRINKHLVALGAEFEIDSLDHRRDKKSIRLQAINVTLNEQQVSITKAQDDATKPSFKNVLSEGDRRTLALAFFLSQLDALPSLNNTIIVFDDPVTSMDDNRKTLTIETIDKLRNEAEQLIVLSHRRRFVYTIFTQYIRARKDRANTKLLKVCPQRGSPAYSEIDEWPIEDASFNEFRRRYKIVFDFAKACTNSASPDVAGHLRFLLEFHFECLYHDLFPPGTSLGRWINEIQSSKAGDPLHSYCRMVETDLKYFNILSRTSSHPTLAEFTDAEIRKYCIRVSAMIGRTI